MSEYNENVRISSVSREEFPADQVEIFDHIMETRKLTFMADLFGTMAHSPGALQAVASVGEHVRFHSVLDEVLREMVICTVSQEVGNFYEWCHHIHRMPDDMREAVGTPALERVRHRQNQKGDSQGSQKVIQAMSWVKGGQPWMTRPYSEDLRERVVRVVESGTSRNAAAKQFDVSISFVVKLMQRWKQRGTIKADKYGGWKKSNLAPHGDRIRALVMENCDITIDELCVLLAAEGIEAKRSTLGDFLLAQGLSRKKRQPTPPSRSALTSRRREPLGATSNLG